MVYYEEPPWFRMSGLWNASVVAVRARLERQNGPDDDGDGEPLKD